MNTTYSTSISTRSTKYLLVWKTLYAIVSKILSGCLTWCIFFLCNTLHPMMTSSSGNFFPRYWLFVRGIHRSPVNSPHKPPWRGALMFSLISAWINGWVNNREAGDLRRHRANCNVTVMSDITAVSVKIWCPCTPNVKVWCFYFKYRCKNSDIVALYACVVIWDATTPMWRHCKHCRQQLKCFALKEDDQIFIIISTKYV